MTAHPVYGIGTAALSYIGDTVGRSPDKPLGEVSAITAGRVEVWRKPIAGTGRGKYAWFSAAELALIARGEP